MREIVYLLTLIMVSIGMTGCSAKGADEQVISESTEKEEEVITGEFSSNDVVVRDEETSLLFSVKEIQSEYDVETCEIALVNLKPCIVSAGKAYIYVDGWNVVEADNDIVKVYNGDTFCALDCVGNLITIADEFNHYESYPLTSAGIYYNAEEMLKLTEEENILLLSGNPLESEYCIAYFEGGYTRLFVNGEMTELSDSIAVADISGRFILSDEGNVYQVSWGENPSNARLEQVSEGKYIGISACTSADRCIGICEDGTVAIWSDVELNFVFNTENAKAAAMGFDYGIVLCDDGHIEFHSSDSAMERQVSEYFDNVDEQIFSVTCSYDSIAVTLKNGNVRIVNLL